MQENGKIIRYPRQGNIGIEQAACLMHLHATIRYLAEVGGLVWNIGAASLK
jgi:hypothetical protein